MKFMVGLILGILIVPVGAWFYLHSGSAPVAASDPMLPFEKDLARAALHARIAKEAPQRDVATFSTEDLVSGADVYQKNCAFCHGLPQQPASAASKGMFPRAPQLFTADDTVTDDPVGVTYWKVKNGIRLSGMPGFSASLTEQQMWQASALVARADKLPAQVLSALKPVPDAITPVPAMPIAPNVPPAVAPALHPISPSPQQ
jgi:thiosulfate dehydrogenase